MTTTWQFAVMHPEESEDSWRPAGFRIIHATERYLGCVADPSHRCYNTTEVDPPLPLEHLDPPQAELDMELAEAVQGGQFVDMMGGRMKMSEGPPDCTKVNQLLERGASITRSRHSWMRK
ncbi:hypothetical protein WJX72_003992 [[Myrmecia] bisecta]|uniref:Uncharacterized protein n=1 Tax=[Myrmecia] bisecta TaxID=41462 RepID=A0AAW1PCQ7_9CHLO